jgi:hypothetical protein
MIRRTSQTEMRTVRRLLDVVTALDNLGWKKGEDQWLVLDNRRNGFVQTWRHRKHQCVLEWSDEFNPRRPKQGPYRAQTMPKKGRVLVQGAHPRGAFSLFENDLVSFSKVIVAFFSFWSGKPRPDLLYWRDLTRDLHRQEQWQKSRGIKPWCGSFPKKRWRKNGHEQIARRTIGDD